MDELLIEKRQNTPGVNFNPKNGFLIFEGRSIPENPIKFYQPLEKWLEDFFDTNPAVITFEIHLDYLNTHSTECLYILIKKLESYQLKSSTDVSVVWKFDEDDEDMEYVGKDFKQLTSLPFTYVKVAIDNC